MILVNNHINMVNNDNDFDSCFRSSIVSNIIPFCSSSIYSDFFLIFKIIGIIINNNIKDV